MFKTLFKNLCPIKVLISSRGGHALLSTEVTESTAGQPGRLLLTSTVCRLHPTSRGNTVES